MTNAKKRIQFDDPNYDAEALEQLGQANVDRENKLLRFMFKVSPALLFDEHERNFRLAQQLHYRCGLEAYRPLLTTTDTGYSTSTEFHDMYHQVLSALEALVDRALVRYEYYIQFEDQLLADTRKTKILTPESENWGIDYQARLDGVTQAAANSNLPLIGEAEHCTLRFIGARYTLTPKGYDVAVTFQEHEDQAQRFQQQQEITNNSAQSAAASAKTARRALWAASFIAAGSIGNFVLALLKHLE